MARNSSSKKVGSKPAAPPGDILALLKGGDRRTIGRSEHVAALVSKNPQRFHELIAGLWSEDPLIRMRSADAAEKVTRQHPEFLEPHGQELLGLMSETEQQEVRWHLAAMIPRLWLSPKDRQAALRSPHSYLRDRSSIVKTFALQGLADLAAGDPTIRAEVIETLRESAKNGTAAMKARSGKLLARIEKKPSAKIA